MSEYIVLTEHQACRAAALAVAVDLHSKRSDITHLLPTVSDVLKTATTLAEYIRTGEGR